MGVLVFVVLVLVLAAAVLTVVVVNLCGFMRHSWHSATLLGRGAGIAVGVSAVCALAVRVATDHGLWEPMLSTPGIVIWCGLTMKLASWLHRRKLPSHRGSV